MKRRIIGTIALAVMVSLTGCGGGLSFDDLNPFSGREQILPGERQEILAEPNPLAVDPALAVVQAIILPPAINNGDWSQPGGNPANAPGHLAYSGSGQRIWMSSAGRGTGSHGNISASPVISGGRIFVMDVEGKVTALTASGGGRAWQVSIVPEGDDDDGITGGGLAADGGNLFAATGYGEIIAFDQGTGQRRWTTKMDIPLRSAPTVANGILFVVGTDNRVFAVSIADGSQLWSFRGIPETTGLVSSASPAVSGDIVVVPFSSGEIIAFQAATGQPIWAESLTRTRSFTSLSGIREVAARPVIQDGVVYAVSVSGRMIATGLASGERVWTKNFAGVHTPAIAGESLFAVDIRGKLAAMSRATGQVLWLVDMPKNEDNETWAGPVVAGGRLWLASSEGRLVSVDPASGRMISEHDIGDPVRLQPIVASSTIYVFTDDANLVAFN